MNRPPTGGPLRARLAGLATALACLLWAPAGGAGGVEERIRFDHVSLSEGLSQVSVTAILQDRLGTMWLGTQDGLDRWDGYHMRVFKHDPTDPTTLSNSSVAGLFEDREGSLWVLTNQAGALDRFDPVREGFERLVLASGRQAASNPNTFYEDRFGRLWLGTFGAGIDVIDRAGGAVTHLRHDPEDPGSLPHDFVAAILEDRDGEVWVATSGGLARWRAGQEPAAGGEERFERFVHDPADPGSLGHDLLGALYEDSAGVLWIGTAGGGLDRWDAERRRFVHYRNDPADPDSLASDTIAFMVNPILEDPAGGLWVITTGGVTRLDRSRSRLVSYRGDPSVQGSLSNGVFSTAHVDRAGTLWIASLGGGLHRYDEAHDDFVTYRHDAADPESLASNLVLAIHEGRSGILWFGTSSGGVSRFSRRSHKFRQHRRGADRLSGLRDDMVFSLLEDRGGKVWVGTQSGGLHRLDAGRRRVEAHFGLQGGGPRELGSNWVRAIAEDRSGRLWVGTQGGGLALLNGARDAVAQRFTNSSADSASLSHNAVSSIYEDHLGELWIATNFGWNRRRRGGGFARFFNDPQDPGSLIANGVRFTWEDRAGELWVGTFGGLGRFDRATETFTNYPADPANPRGLASGNVMDLYEGDDGRIWVATYGGGVNVLDRATDSFTRLTARDGLPNDAVYSLLPDADGNLWLATNRGLSKLDPASRSFINYDADDGLVANEFNGRAFFRTAAGELLFGGVGGFVSFDPRQIRADPYVPPVVLTAFHLYGRVEHAGAYLAGLERIELSHRDDFFGFEFAALDYGKPEKTRYMYRLEGFDRDWIDVGTRRWASYTNLDGGSYTFRVRGASGDGVWNEAGASIVVVVEPPPWKTWWAYGVYLLLACGGVFGYVRAKTAAQQREMRRALERERLLAEHRRRSTELERAREIQLSMLPAGPPEAPDLDVAVHMSTATEVGGDYYDFFPQDDGSLYAVAGDATGHGLSAGMMVSMTKSALKALEVCSPQELLAELNAVLRAVNPERMNMALAIVHIDGGHVSLSSAGMPPVYHVRAAGGEVREILLPGLPLGAMAGTEYDLRVLELARGDVLVLCSDGLPELLEECGAPAGYVAIVQRLEEAGQGSAGDVLAALLDHGDCDPVQRDDVTVVVIRRTGI